MRLEILVAALCGAAATASGANIVAGVRAAVGRGDFAAAQAELGAYRAQRGLTPEWLEAFSWLGRGALKAGSPEKAAAWSAETHRMAVQMLHGRALDAEPHLPIALGAAIEVQAQAQAARGERGEAVAYLRQQLAQYGQTSIRTRIQKNINLLTLEGKPAPALVVERFIGPRPEPLAALKGRPVLLFFWAHWCGDCKADAPEIVKLKAKYKDLAVVAPTQHYGYVAGGLEASPDRETPYIEQTWRKYYGPLGQVPVPVSAENFRNYGASTVPTLVLLDREGIVRLYHPGAMSFADLAARVDAILKP